MNWPTVSLREVLRLEIDAVPVHADVTYRFAGVYSFGRGLFERGPINGSETTYRVFHRLHTDQFVMSQVKGWEGALARVTSEFNGFFLSPVYPTFIVDSVRLDPGYLAFFFRQSTTWTMLERMSRGIGARRNSVYPDMLLSIEIPLPPLAEQRRIVAKIARLAGKIEEARGLREASVDHQNQLLRSLLFGGSGGSCVETPMYELVRLRQPDVNVVGQDTYHFAGIYCFGRGMFRGQIIQGTETSYKRLTRLQRGNFTYPKLMAWEGAFAIVPSDCEGLVVSPEFPVFEVNTNCVMPEVLEAHFTDPTVWAKVSGESTGTNVRRRRLHPNDLLRYRFPLPTSETQEAYQRVKTRIAAASAIQAQAAAELDALLPAILDRAFKGAL